MPIAITSRLLVRRLLVRDVEPLCGILGHADVMHFSLSGPLSPDQVQAWLDRRMEAACDGKPSMYGVTDRADPALLGFCGFIPFDDPDGEASFELGYRFHPSHWGNGIATEAARAVLRYGLDTLRLGPITAVIDPANAASMRVAEKSGMHYTGDMLYHDVPVRRYVIHP